jgi:hypothetical protein
VVKTGETCVYTPTAGYFGADSFTYTINDGTDTSTGTVNITVLECTLVQVAVLDAWTDYANGTPNNRSGAITTGTNINPTNGTDELFLVAITMENEGSVTGNVTGVWVDDSLGTQLTEIYSTNNDAVQHAWMGYLASADIPGGNFVLYFEYDNNEGFFGNNVTSYHVKWASYENVHQTDIYTTTNGRGTMRILMT